MCFASRFMLAVILEALTLPDTVTLPVTCHKFGPFCISYVMPIGVKMDNNKGYLCIYSRI